MNDPTSRRSAQRTLIAVGNAGRQLLRHAMDGRNGFDRTILVAKPVPGLLAEPGVYHVQYLRDRVAACRCAEVLSHGAGQVSVFGAAGGRSTALILLRLAAALSEQERVRVVVASPFSWEDRRRQWRALYVRFRLQQMRGVKLSVVVTGKVEKEMDAETPMDHLLARIMQEAWESLVE